MEVVEKQCGKTLGSNEDGRRQWGAAQTFGPGHSGGWSDVFLRLLYRKLHDLLRSAVIENAKILDVQISHGTSGGIPHHNGDQDKIHADAECCAAILRRRLSLSGTARNSRVCRHLTDCDAARKKTRQDRTNGGKNCNAR